MGKCLNSNRAGRGGKGQDGDRGMHAFSFLKDAISHIVIVAPSDADHKTSLLTTNAKIGP